VLVAAWDQNLKRFKFRGAECWLVAAWRPSAGSILEPVRPETVGDTPWNLTSRSTTSEPDEESWDFDGNVLTSAKNRTRRSPMLTHETSPFSGASVMGMTSGISQGQRYLPAGIPGISMALGQEDRLCSKGRLCQQSPSDSTEESQSWRRRKDLPNGRFAKSGLAPTTSTEARDGHDASHVQTPPTSGQEPSPRKDPRQKGEHMPPRCRSKGGKALL
jgi:hypothetical protein